MLRVIIPLRKLYRVTMMPYNMLQIVGGLDEKDIPVSIISPASSVLCSGVRAGRNQKKQVDRLGFLEDLGLKKTPRQVEIRNPGSKGFAPKRTQTTMKC